jgi:hypothetical protein
MVHGVEPDGRMARTQTSSVSVVRVQTVLFAPGVELPLAGDERSPLGLGLPGPGLGDRLVRAAQRKRAYGGDTQRSDDGHVDRPS